MTSVLASALLSLFCPSDDSKVLCKWASVEVVWSLFAVIFPDVSGDTSEFVSVFDKLEKRLGSAGNAPCCDDEMFDEIRDESDSLATLRSFSLLASIDGAITG